MASTLSPSGTNPDEWRKSCTIQLRSLLSRSLQQRSATSAPVPENKQAAMVHAAEYRTFTTADGKIIQACLRDFSESTGSVEMELSDGSRQTVELATLSEEDQSCVRDWYSMYSLLSRGRFRVTAEERNKKNLQYHGTLDGWHEMFPNMGYRDDWHTTWPGTTYDEISYEMIVENRTDLSLSNVLVEVCIYHQTKIKGHALETVYRESSNGWHQDGQPEKLPAQSVSNALYDKVSIPELHAGDRIKHLTKPIKLLGEQEEFQTPPREGRPKDGERSTRNVRTVTGKLLGIRYRVYIPLLSGGYAMREFANPESLIEETEWPGGK